MTRSVGFALAMPWDTSSSPLAMVLIKTRRGQGVAGEVSGSLDQFVEGSLQGVDFPSLGPCPLPVGSPVVPLNGFEGGDELGIDPGRHVLRSDPTAPPDRSVEVGSAVAIDEPHMYYALLRAPVKASIRRIS
jgi:hypothetical protein